VAVKSVGERLLILAKRLDRQDRIITDLQTALAAANHRLADLADNQHLLDRRLRAASTGSAAALVNRAPTAQWHSTRDY